MLVLIILVLIVLLSKFVFKIFINGPVLLVWLAITQLPRLVQNTSMGAPLAEFLYGNMLVHLCWLGTAFWLTSIFYKKVFKKSMSKQKQIQG